MAGAAMVKGEMEPPRATRGSGGQQRNLRPPRNTESPADRPEMADQRGSDHEKMAEPTHRTAPPRIYDTKIARIQDSAAEHGREASAAHVVVPWASFFSPRRTLMFGYWRRLHGQFRRIGRTRITVALWRLKWIFNNVKPYDTRDTIPKCEMIVRVAFLHPCRNTRDSVRRLLTLSVQLVGVSVYFLSNSCKQGRENSANNVSAVGLSPPLAPYEVITNRVLEI